MAEKHVMLKPTHPGPFRRCVRSKPKRPPKGGPVPPGTIRRTLVFDPGDVVELRGADLAAVAGDLGTALLEVEEDEEKPGRWRPVATSEPVDVTPEEVEPPPEEVEPNEPDPEG